MLARTVAHMRLGNSARCLFCHSTILPLSQMQKIMVNRDATNSKRISLVVMPIRKQLLPNNFLLCKTNVNKCVCVEFQFECFACTINAQQIQHSYTDRFTHGTQRKSLQRNKTTECKRQSNYIPFKITEASYFSKIFFCVCGVCFANATIRDHTETESV